VQVERMRPEGGMMFTEIGHPDRAPSQVQLERLCKCAHVARDPGLKQRERAGEAVELIHRRVLV